MTHPILQVQSLVTNFVVTYGYNLLFKKINNIATYFKNLIIELHVIYLQICQILCQSNAIYYLIHKIIFYT